MNRQNWVIYYVFVVCPATKILTLNSVQAIQINDIYAHVSTVNFKTARHTQPLWSYSSYIEQRVRFANSQGNLAINITIPWKTWIAEHITDE